MTPATQPNFHLAVSFIQLSKTTGPFLDPGAAARRAAGAAVWRKLRNCETMVAAYLERPLASAIAASGVSGSHPSRFSSELRASRNCGQRSCDRLSGKLAAGCDASVDCEAETFDGKAKVQCFRGMASETWRQNESAIPPPQGSSARRARLHPPPGPQAQPRPTHLAPPRPPTAVSNPTKTKQSQKSNAASSQTGVRPRPT